MAGVIANTDVTAQLPDEVLCHVLSFLTLKDKLRSERLNHRFKRCVLEELKANPKPLEVDLDFGLFLNRLNEHILPGGWLIGAVQTLAKKTKFSRISVDIVFPVFGSPTHQVQLDRILSLLVLESQCLSKVTSFESNFRCSEAVMKNFLDKCDKLSTIKLSDFTDENDSNASYPLELCRLLRDRGVTELKLGPFRFRPQGVVHLFPFVKPNSLRKLDLTFEGMPELDVVRLVNALKHNAGSTLEEINLVLREVRVQMADFFESLAGLPALRKCHIDCFHLKPSDQFVPAVTSLLSLFHTNIKMTANWVSSLTVLRDCQVVNIIRQIQNVHPGLEIDFDTRGNGMSLSLGNASIRNVMEIGRCGALDCVRCKSLYPIVLNFLRTRASRFTVTQHLPNWQLDPCKVDQIVDDLNAIPSAQCNALSAEHNEIEQSVTVNFESNVAGPHLFSITIGCGGRCLNGCIKCVN